MFQPRIKSAISSISTASSHLLEPPAPDVRADVREPKTEDELVELRKRNQHVIGSMTSVSVFFYFNHKRI